MLNYEQMRAAIATLKDWELVSSFTVGGFDYMGFSVSEPYKLLILSGQRDTVYDCSLKRLVDAEVIVDEKTFIAMCDLLPDEFIPIAGSYGGSIPHETAQGERVEITYHDPHTVSGKELIYQQIEFVDLAGNRTVIFDSYPSYVCGFSSDGNYFALADDGALWVLKRRA